MAQFNLAQTGEAQAGVQRALNAQRHELDLRCAWIESQRGDRNAEQRYARVHAQQLASVVVEQGLRIAELAAEVLSAAMLAKERDQEACRLHQLANVERK